MKTLSVSILRMLITAEGWIKLALYMYIIKSDILSYPNMFLHRL